MAFALTLPVAAGVLRWPWWMILIIGVGNVTGYLITHPRTVRRLREQDGLLLVTGLAVVSNTVVCAILLGLGRLIRLI